MAGGGYAEFALVDQGALFKIPDSMSFDEAGALPEVMMTVWANIFDRCQFKAGESVLVHGGTSGIGTMATRYDAAARYMIVLLNSIVVVSLRSDTGTLWRTTAMTAPAIMQVTPIIA